MTPPQESVLHLVLMRHAKSSWTSQAPTDHARPLNKRGRRDAPRMAQRLLDLGWFPDRVIASDSARTRETWARMAPAGPPSARVRFTAGLYECGIEGFVDAVRDEPSTPGIRMLLAHNPGCEELVEWLLGRAVRITTGNAVLLRRSAVAWCEALEPDQWSMIDVLRPREPRDV